MNLSINIGLINLWVMTMENILRIEAKKYREDYIKRVESGRNEQ